MSQAGKLELELQKRETASCLYTYTLKYVYTAKLQLLGTRYVAPRFDSTYVCTGAIQVARS